MKIGTYLHSKSGNKYKVHFVAKHSETLEELVVYECLYDNPRSKYWVRSKAMFEEIVEIDGVKKPRFEYLGE